MATILRLLDCDGEGTTMVGLRWSVYYDAMVREIRWLGYVGQGTTMIGLWW